GMSSESVQALVVTHNRKAVLLACLDGIARPTHPAAGVLVVDNASTDGTADALVACGLPARRRPDVPRIPRTRRAPASAARVAEREEPPRRAFFIRVDDLEWVSRLRRHGGLWLLPGAEIVHKDPRPLAGVGPLALWRDLRRGHRFEESWKLNYGLRNMIWCG